MATRADDVVFWRRAFVRSTSAVSQPVAENLGVAVNVNQRNNTVIHVLWAADLSGGYTLPASGSTVALDEPAATGSGRVVVALDKVYNTAMGDTVPDPVTFVPGVALNGYHRLIFAGGNGASPLGADGCVMNKGVSATMSAASLAITERCRVLRYWLNIQEDDIPPAPTPDLITGVDLGLNGNVAATYGTTSGFDYSVRIQDLGTMEPGETVAAQSTTLLASENWMVVTLCLKLSPVMEPQVIYGGIASASTSNVTIFSSTNYTPLDGALATDHIFIASSGTIATDGFTRIGTAGTTTSLWHKQAASFNANFSSSDSHAAAQFFVVRGLDPNTPYTVTEDQETENPIDVPDGTIVRQGDMDLSLFLFRGSTVDSGQLIASGGDVVYQGATANSNNRWKGTWAFRKGLAPGVQTGLTAATTLATVLTNGHSLHVILRRPPNINKIETTLIADISMEAILTVGGGAKFVETTFDLSVTFGARFRTSRPVFVARRPLLVIRDFNGEVVNVLD